MPLPTPVRAALLMLGSTMFFGLMVVAIRLASASLHTFEIAFFRNFFGLIVALPLLLRHGPGFLRTTQFPKYLFRCLIGICSMLAGRW
jgi:drug/metabolite transporter (DMT)-like permease